MTDYLRQALTDDAEAVARQLEGNLTENQVLALEQKERVLYGEGGDVRQRLPQLNEETDQETYRQTAPRLRAPFCGASGAAARFAYRGQIRKPPSALAPNRARASDPLLSSLERYSEGARELLTVYKPTSRDDTVWMHPGEPVFDLSLGRDSGTVRACRTTGRCVYRPPTRPRRICSTSRGFPSNSAAKRRRPICLMTVQIAKTRPSRWSHDWFGLRQSSDGTLTELPVEHLLLLRGADAFAPSRVPLATLARGMVADVLAFAREEIGERIAQLHRQGRFDNLPSRVESINRGFDFQAAELAAAPRAPQPTGARRRSGRGGGTWSGQGSPAPLNHLPKSTPRRAASRTGARSGG